MASVFGHIQINPQFVFFKRKHVFAMVVHNPIKEGRKDSLFKLWRYIGMPKCIEI
jgi:hypothetical protein